MAKRPSYIGLLNDIATGERERYEVFKHWAATTKDEKLKPTLDMVVIREMEHSWAFEKRLCELGYSLDPVKPNKALLKTIKSNTSDEEKFAAIGIVAYGDQSDEADALLLQMLADKNIDPRTDELIGRFICEERDSAAQLLKAYKTQQRRRSARTTKKAV